MNTMHQFLENVGKQFHVNPRFLKRYEELSKGSFSQLNEMLLKEGWCSRDELGDLISKEFNVSYVNLSDIFIDYNLFKVLKKEMAEKMGVVPLHLLGQCVTIACGHELTDQEKKELELCFGKKVSMVFSFEDDIKTYLKIGYYGADIIKKNIEDLVLHKLATLEKQTPAAIERLIDTKQIVDIVDGLLLMAIRERSSDIHMEPKKRELIVRYRIDGKLKELFRLPREIIPAVTSRCMILAGVDISDQRKPQDGRFTFTLSGNSIDVRASFLPTNYGNCIVLRLLKFESPHKVPKLIDMGFTKSILRELQNTLQTQSGMLFVTGPTGSGKTTTLYGIIEHLSSPDNSIVTIEDPIEYEIPGITQVSVDVKVNRTFPAVLRAVLRQDPDVILIGEIRDLETAQIATTAALTGHAVLTTLHTNNAIQAVTRMIDMGVHHFVIAPSIIGVINQRLVRRICENCKVAYQPSYEELAPFFKDISAEKLPLLYKGSGCERCHYTGYFYRIPIHEFLKITDEMRDCILRNGTYNELFDLAYKSGYRDLRYDGFAKVLKGYTTLDEILNATAYSSDS